MLTQDFVENGRRVTRMDVAKQVVQDFIAKREHDRIGVVLFARYAVTHAPLTTDHTWLLANLKKSSSMIFGRLRMLSKISLRIKRRW